MSTKIGGPHVCNIHPDFEPTDDSDLWNQHCQETEGHETFGHVPCVTCKADIDMGSVPYQPIGTETRLQCPNCFNKYQDLNNMVVQRMQQNNQLHMVNGNIEEVPQ